MKATVSGSSSTRLPSDIRKWIKGRIIDLSSTSRYYQKCAESVHPRVRRVAIERDGHQYELANDFFQLYMDLLHEIVSRNYNRSEMKGADFLARAFYRAGWLFGRQQGPVEPSPWEVWPKTRPICEAWERLGELAGSGGTSGTSVVLEDPGPGHKLRLPRPGQFEHPRISLSVTFITDREKLPKLTIEIEGSPVCVLRKGMYLLRDIEERKATRKDSKRIFDGLMDWVYADLGIGRLSRGRPAEALGRDAAYLHDHFGLSWTQVAQRLCPKRHRHDRSCKENLRSQAHQFWVKQRRSAAALPPV